LRKTGRELGLTRRKREIKGSVDIFEPPKVSLIYVFPLLPPLRGRQRE
jgi:hypothetical protein